MNPDVLTLRRLALEFAVDVRTLTKELREPGSVRGAAGARARQALATLQADKSHAA